MLASRMHIQGEGQVLLCSREQWNKMRFQIITQTEDDKFDPVTREFLHACRRVSFASSRFLSERASHQRFHMPLSLSHHPRSFCGSVPLIMSPAARRDDHSAHAVLIFFFFLSACDFFASSLSKKGDLELRAGAEEWRERETTNSARAG